MGYALCGVNGIELFQPLLFGCIPLCLPFLFTLFLH